MFNVRAYSTAQSCLPDAVAHCVCSLDSAATQASEMMGEMG